MTFDSLVRDFRLARFPEIREGTQAEYGHLLDRFGVYALRQIPLPSQLIAALKPWGLACPKSELELVFPNGTGQPESPTNFINRGLHPALRRAGLRRIRFHDLRHCYASLLIDAGEPLLVVSRLLGHSSIKITADTYRHLMPDIAEGIGQRLGDRIFAKSAPDHGHFWTPRRFRPLNRLMMKRK